MRHQKHFLTIQSETAHSICKIIMKEICAAKEQHLKNPVQFHKARGCILAQLS